MKKFFIIALAALAFITAAHAAQPCLTNVAVYAEPNSTVRLPIPSDYTSINFEAGFYLLSYPSDPNNPCGSAVGPTIEFTFKGDHCPTTVEKIGEVWWNCTPACDPSGVTHKLDIQAGPGVHSVVVQIIVMPGAGNCTLSYCVIAILPCYNPPPQED